jgi:hypothetical protein
MEAVATAAAIGLVLAGTAYMIRPTCPVIEEGFDESGEEGTVRKAIVSRVRDATEAAYDQVMDLKLSEFIKAGEMLFAESFAQPTDPAFERDGTAPTVAQPSYLPRFNAREAAAAVARVSAEKAFGADFKPPGELLEYLTDKYIEWNGDSGRVINLAETISLVSKVGAGASPEEKAVPVVVAALRRGEPEKRVVETVDDYVQYSERSASSRPDTRLAVTPGLSMLKRPWASAAEKMYENVTYSRADEMYPINSLTAFGDDGERLAPAQQRSAAGSRLESEWPFRDR